MENKTQFRSAGFGGFNRQDVLTYIEQTAAETAQQLDELRAQRDEVQEREDALKSQLQDLTAEHDALQEQYDALSAERDGLVARLKKLEPLQLQVPLLQSQLDRLTPDAEAYSGLKNQISDIELESRRRAGEIVSQAQKEADATIAAAKKAADETTAAAKKAADETTAAAKKAADQQRSAAKQDSEKRLANADKDAAARVAAAKKQANEIVSKAETQAAAATKQAQQQVAAEQARTKNLRSQLTNSYESTRASVQDTVTRCLADVEQMRDALVKLQGNFEDAKKLLPDNDAKEKAGE